MPGGDLTLTYLLDPGDYLFAIYGLGPEQSIDTPPFDGQLCILPFSSLLLLPNWPFDEFELRLGIPADQNLSGVEVLFQGLIGPRLTDPKDAAWTNCTKLTIE